MDEDEKTESKQPFDPAQGRQILERRKEIEGEIVGMLKETDPTSPRLRRGKEQFTLQNVKDAIYNEEETDDFQDVLMMFDNGNPENLSNAVEGDNDAWNYFPHKALGGISPAEKLLEHRQSPK